MYLAQIQAHSGSYQQRKRLRSCFIHTTFCSGMGMGVPLFFSDIKNPLRVIGAWGSGAGLESTSFDFVLLDMLLFTY